MALTLLVLAAGMGARYGGLKQMDPVGPRGETMLDYAVYDACRAGFTKVVFVIRSEFESAFREQIGGKYRGQIEVEYAFQSVNALPENTMVIVERQKPWGTGHAVWCAREKVRENFAVINADDFYGADSFARLAEFLAAARDASFAMVGFRLSNTLSEHGAVSRGICDVDARGTLRSVAEQSGILAGEVGPTHKLTGNEIVSMNCWGFTPALFPSLETLLRAFLTAIHEKRLPEQAEFYLPAAVSAAIGRGEAHVQVIPTTSAWFGVTFREDKSRVQTALAKLVAAGVYPAQLF